mgnify:CR=1 FL=1
MKPQKRLSGTYNGGSLGFGVGRPHIVLQLGKSAIALKVEVKALEESCDLENAVATPLDRFDLIVQALYWPYRTVPSTKPLLSRFAK